MTDRPTASTITDAQLDELYEQLDALRHHRASVLADGQPHTDRERGVVQAVTRIRAALDGPTRGTAATQATEPREHCGHTLPVGVSTTSTECVLPPGHSGSHADHQGARWWKTTPHTTTTDGTVCNAYQTPTAAEMAGLCARCGMYDYRHQATPVDTAHRYCILCGNRVQPGHQCDQNTVMQRLVEARDRAAQLATALREILNEFAYCDHEGVACHQSRHVTTAQLTRWRATLNPPKEQPRV